MVEPYAAVMADRFRCELVARAMDGGTEGPFSLTELFTLWHGSALGMFPPPDPEDPEMGIGWSSQHWFNRTVQHLLDSGAMVETGRKGEALAVLGIKERVTAIREERKTYERKRRPSPSARVRRELDERDGHSCARCGSMDELQVDHVLELIEGGATTLDNLQWLCRTCNAQKEFDRRTELREFLQACL